MLPADGGNWVHPPQLHPGVPGQRSAEGEGEWPEWQPGTELAGRFVEVAGGVWPIVRGDHQIVVFQKSSAAMVACANLWLRVRCCPTRSLGFENCQASRSGSIPHNFRKEVSLGILGI